MGGERRRVEQMVLRCWQEEGRLQATASGIARLPVAVGVQAPVVLSPTPAAVASVRLGPWLCRHIKLATANV